jgi:hypothetical protein
VGVGVWGVSTLGSFRIPPPPPPPLSLMRQTPFYASPVINLWQSWATGLFVLRIVFQMVDLGELRVIE